VYITIIYDFGRTVSGKKRKIISKFDDVLYVTDYGLIVSLNSVSVATETATTCSTYTAVFVRRANGRRVPYVSTTIL